MTRSFQNHYARRDVPLHKRPRVFAKPATLADGRPAYQRNQEAGEAR